MCPGMRFFLIIGLILFVFSCNKIKERKLTGTFSGALSWYESKYESSTGEPPFEQIVTSWTDKSIQEVDRLGDEIFVASMNSYKIDLNQVGSKGNAYFHRAGGHRSVSITISENDLVFRIVETINDGGDYEYCSILKFSGVKIE